MDIAHCDCHRPKAKSDVNERPRYYARQLVTPEDMTLEQDYFRAKLRRHNRYMHGWGVVCGAHVVAAEQPWKVIIKPGYILGPYGDDICIERDQCLDVRKKCVASEPQTPDDCGCSEAMPVAPSDGKLYVAIRYLENRTRPIRVAMGGCACDESACEHSRFADGFEICVIDHCPDSHRTPKVPVVGAATPDCPEHPSDPWVVLSEITVDEETKKVTTNDCACRRHAVSFAGYWWACMRVDMPTPFKDFASAAAPDPIPGTL